MREQITEDYESPIMEVVEIHVEQGFAASEDNIGMTIPDWEVIG